jgi:thiamine thiazole synthase
MINRSGLSAQLPIDPVVLTARAVIDATGHEAAVFEMLRRRRALTSGDAPENAHEGPMNAPEGERFVVSRTGQVWPGLWICGMTVCAAHHGPRMGPIFGGMLLSGRRVADTVGHALSFGGGSAAS